MYFDDVDLFSLRTIKNATNPNGIDMGTSENLEAVVVYTNILRMAINMKKAEIISKNQSNPKIIVCAAYDTISSETVSNIYQKQLLQLDV